MTFDEVMEKHFGKWEDGHATIRDRSGFIWIIAKGDKDKYVLTTDGKRYVTDEPVAVVEEKKPEPVVRRGRKAVDSANE